MSRSRSMTTAALLLSAVAASVVASGCSGNRTRDDDNAAARTDTATYGGAVAADRMRDTSASFGGTTPSSSLDRDRNDDRATPTRSRRARRSPSVRRQTATDTALGIGPMRPDTSRADTTTIGNLGVRDSARVGQDSVQAESPAPDTNVTVSPAQPDSLNVTTPPASLQQDTLYPDTLRPQPDTTQPTIPGDTSRPLTPTDPTNPGEPKLPVDTTQPDQPQTPSDTTQPQTPQQPVQNPPQLIADTGITVQPSVSAVPADATNAVAADPGTPTDAQIASLVITVNTADSAGGALASTRATNMQVREYARMMVQDHGAANVRIDELLRRLNIQPDSALEDIRNLRRNNEEEARDLASKTGAEFDRAYIDNEVELHQRALETLDAKLIPGADNAELKTLLQETRQTVTRHLERAREIQTSLRGN